MQLISDVQVSSAARRVGLIGPGPDNVSVSTLRAFLKALGVPVEDRGPFEKVPPANLSLGTAGVGSGAKIG